MKYNIPGTYEIEYTATDECGNATSEIRKVTVKEPPKTFINEDSTGDKYLHINVTNPETFRADNTIIAEYPGLGYGNDYVWNSANDVLWKDYINEIFGVTIVSAIKPKSTANWFNKCVNMQYVISSPGAIDMSECESIKYMFSECRELTSIAFGIKNWDVSKVTDMRSVFYEVPLTYNFDLSKWDTSNVTNMYYMFYGSGCTTLDLTGWDTSKVTSFTNMFSNMSNLTTIKASDKFTVNDYEGNMFNNDTKLVGGQGTTYSVTDQTYARIDGGAENPGYFTQG